MNMSNTNNTNTKGKVFARVVFFMAQNPDNDRWEALAYFPDIPWENGSKNKTSYMHDGQNGPCAESFIFEDCKIPRNKFDLAAVRRLKAELEKLPEAYVLTVLDTREWLASNAKRAAEVKSTIDDIRFKKDQEKVQEEYDLLMEA